MYFRGLLLVVATIFSGCGDKNETSSDSAVTTVSPAVTKGNQGAVKQGTRRPPQPVVNPPKVEAGEYSVPGFTSIHVAKPKSGTHRATLIYLHARTGNGKFESELILEKGVLNGVSGQMRIVAPQYQSYEWFPFINVPGGDLYGSPGRIEDVNKALDSIKPIVEHEAALLGGDYSKIFLFGFSQGAMMAAWTGLMMDRNFGGVVCFAGANPVFGLPPVPANSQRVPIFHIHDPQDETVKFQVAQSGAEAARKAGALGYEPIREAVIGGKTHHGLSYEALMITNEWLMDQLSAKGIVPSR